MTIQVCFIGFGNIAKALAQGFEKNSAFKLYATSPSLPHQLSNDGISTHFDNTAFLNAVDIIILAVKPPLVNQVLTEIRPYLSPKSIVISVASGITLSQLAAGCNENQPLARAMPNLPTSMNVGATPLIANSSVTLNQKAVIEQVFSRVGVITWLESEANMNAFTALSGSGPAYVFFFMEAMIKAAQTMNISPSLAKTFTLQTIKGALALVEESALPIESLRKKVTSPAGTTAAALGILQDNNFEQLIIDAIKAASARAFELEKTAL